VRSAARIPGAAPFADNPFAAELARVIEDNRARIVVGTVEDERERLASGQDPRQFILALLGDGKVRADTCTVVIGSIRPCQPFDFTDFSVCLLSLSLTSWVLSWEFFVPVLYRLQAFGSRSRRARDRAQGNARRECCVRRASCAR